MKGDVNIAVGTSLDRFLAIDTCNPPLEAKKNSIITFPSLVPRVKMLVYVKAPAIKIKIV